MLIWYVWKWQIHPVVCRNVKARSNNDWLNFTLSFYLKPDIHIQCQTAYNTTSGSIHSWKLSPAHALLLLFEQEPVWAILKMYHLIWNQWCWSWKPQTQKLLTDRRTRSLFWRLENKKTCRLLTVHSRNMWAWTRRLENSLEFMQLKPKINQPYVVMISEDSL